MEQHWAYSSMFSAALFLIIPHISDCSFYGQHCSFFGDFSHFFLPLSLSRGTIIAANIDQAMINLKLWLSKSSSLHRKLHGGRGLNSQSLACEPHTLPLGYHATIRITLPQLIVDSGISILIFSPFLWYMYNFLSKSA